MTNNKDLMECIAAEEAGRKIECRVIGPKYGWALKKHSGWNTGTYEYRIAFEPAPKQGRWVRKEIRKDRGIYVCHARLDMGLETDCLAIDALQHIPGFGGIEYVDPRHPEAPPVMSSSPVCFNELGTWFIAAFIPGSDMNGPRPGVPVAAWFWEEE